MKNIKSLFIVFIISIFSNNISKENKSIDNNPKINKDIKYLEDDNDSDIEINNNLKNKYFWNLSYNQFLKTNPNYIKKLVYKFMNRKNIHKYFIYGSIFALSSYLYLYPYLNYVNNLVNSVEKKNEINKNLKYILYYDSINKTSINKEYLSKKYNGEKYSSLKDRKIIKNEMDYFLYAINKNFLNKRLFDIFSFTTFYTIKNFYENYKIDKAELLPKIEILNSDDIEIDLNNFGGLFLVKDSFNKLSERINKTDNKVSAGYVLYGGPGTGKTFSAKYLAKKLGWSFMYIDTAAIIPNKKSKFTAAGAVKYIFEQADKLGKAIILFDEFDRIFENNKEIVPEILKLLDIYLKNKNIIVIATTNYIEKFDSALLRAGRLNNIINVDYPSFLERKEIIQSLFKNKNLKINTELLDYISKITESFSSAKISEFINKISEFLIIENKKNISKEIIDICYFEVLFGNRLNNISLNEKAINKISKKIAAEIIYINENEKTYPYEFLIATAKPFEYNYKNKDNFKGSIKKLKILNNNLNIKKEIIETKIKSILLRVLVEEIIFEEKSKNLNFDYLKIKNLIIKIVEIEHPTINKNNKTEIMESLYKDYYEECKNFIKNNLNNINKVSEILIKNDFITKKELQNLICKGQ